MGEYMRNTPINVNGVRNNKDDKWIKLLLSFEKEKLDKYKNIPELVFQRSI